MNTFTINDKKYKAKAFDFNLLCDLEDMGVSLEQANKKPMSMLRAYIALCMGESEDFAGKEMEQHIIKGGKLNDVMVVMSDEMNNSDFFRSLSKTAQEETAKNESKETAVE